jgi:hypothetical protein
MPPAGPLAICDPKAGPDCAIGARKYATTDLHPLWRANPSGIDIDRQPSRREVPDTVAVYQSGLPGAQRRSRSSVRKGGIRPPWVADLTAWARPAERGAARQPEWVRGFRGFSLGSTPAPVAPLDAAASWAIEWVDKCPNLGHFGPRTRQRVTACGVSFATPRFQKMKPERWQSLAA